LGVPAFGRTYTLQNPNKHDVGAPVKGWGEAGPFTQVQGFLGFNEVIMKYF
jgi:chitinase